MAFALKEVSVKLSGLTFCFPTFNFAFWTISNRFSFQTCTLKSALFSFFFFEDFGIARVQTFVIGVRRIQDWRSISAVSRHRCPMSWTNMDEGEEDQVCNIKERESMLALLSEAIPTFQLAEPAIEQIDNNAPANDETIFDFNLFSISKSIDIKEQVENERPYAKQERPLSYYLIDPSDSLQLDQIRSSAISGEEVMRLSQIPWPRCRQVHRVLVISEEKEREAEKSKKRWRPSKRRREREKTAKEIAARTAQIRASARGRERGRARARGQRGLGSSRGHTSGRGDRGRNRGG